ncbi:hypothetical protein JBO49_16260 [Serratia fonticola]|uniref:hypothetical protein n=1 Tax=Serratia fonticola TaxID=47917 RepID=UPI00192AE68A|nr:hypothetical protein [Serratia fonticola]MBL5862159.1 hypothetical protein [Serratia fonticola]
MDYIYLDWNVIQYMKHSTIQKSIDGPAFYDLVKKLSKKYRFPFSEGHLRDLSISFKPENNENIKNDLEYLNILSQGYALGITKQDELIVITKKNIDIHTFFKDIILEQQVAPEFEIAGNSYSVNMTTLPKDDLFRPFLEGSGGVLNPDVMSQFINELLLHMDDPDFYKKFRNQIANMKSNLGRKDTILSKDSNYYKGLIPFFDFITSESADSYIDNFEDVIISFCSINGRCFDTMTVGEKIEMTYMLLDFHPNYRDKVNKKNRPSNIGRDCKNLYFASQAKYYVTEDSSAFRKATFVCKALSLRVKVTSMSDFMAKFC